MGPIATAQHMQRGVAVAVGIHGRGQFGAEGAHAADPGTPSQRRFETERPSPAGVPHVPVWCNPAAFAASGLIANPAATGAEVRNIRDLAGITGILRHPGPGGWVVKGAS